MQVPNGNQPISPPSSRVRELGLVLPTPPRPLGAYVESSDAGNLLFLSGILPVANGKLAISGRLGDNLSVEQGKEAALIASFSALAIAKEHLGDLDRLKKLVKLTVLVSTTEQFTAPLVHLWLLTPYSKLSQCLIQAPNSTNYSKSEAKVVAQ